MYGILSTRRAYGDVFVTVFEDGTIIPWKLLSTEDYIKYTSLIQSDLYPLAFVEDEIFIKCVVDTVLTKSIGTLKAGLVSTVSQNILQHSGPASAQQLDETLALKRQEIDNVLHQIVVWITTAFPSYKLDELYSLSYPELMFCFAQAEFKLMQSGVIKEKFNFFNEGEEKAPVDKKKSQQKRPRPPPPTSRLKSTPNITTPPTKPPVENIAHKFQQQQEEQTIITKADIMEGSIAMDSHGKDPVAHHKAIEETAKMYPDYLEQMKRGEKVNIPSTEERKHAAEKRAELNKQKFETAMKKEQAYTKVELERLKSIREEERKRRSKQRKR